MILIDVEVCPVTSLVRLMGVEEPGKVARKLHVGGEAVPIRKEAAVRHGG